MGKVEVNNLNVPPLAGLCTYEEACRAGHGVEAAVSLLKRYNYTESRLNEILAAHIARTPEWEVKCAFGLHMWLDAEHSAALRKRISEMRQPPPNLNVAPDEALEAWLDEAIRAANTVELLTGIYRVIKPELVRAMKQYLGQANPLAEHPTCRVLKWLLHEEEEMIAWGEKAILAFTETPARAQTADSWEAHLRAFLNAAGGIPGDLDSAEEHLLPAPRADGEPYEMELVPQRDDRFNDNFNTAVSIKVNDYYADDARPYDERVAALFYKRLREMDVPEWMGPIINKTRGKPWEYYADMSRQLWDETRHAMMGEVGMYHMGVPFYRYPVDIIYSHLLNTEVSPLEAHIILWGIEQDLMPRKTGKGMEWDIACASGDHLAIVFQDYDWADEVLHTQIGRKWLIPEASSRADLKARYQDALKRVEAVRQDKLESLSDHTYWWPQLIEDIRHSSTAEVSGR